MKATDLLEKQHNVVDDLFAKFEKASGREKAAIFDEIAKNLVAHDAIEREIFYPACEKALGKDEELLAESLVEHGLVEFSIFRADKNRGAEPFDQYVTVLKEIVEHHVEEEEKELFPKVKRAMGDALEPLGKRMEARFNEALAEDWRAALQMNLKQVIAGRTKTVKKSAAQKKAPARAAKPRTSPRPRASAKKKTARRGAKRVSR